MEKRLELSLEKLRKECEKLEDPRKPGGNTRHALFSILAIPLLAVICGCQEWIEVEDYGKSKEEWLSTFLDLQNGVPSDDTYRRLFEALKPTQLENLYREWVRPYVGTCLGKQVAIDGKTVRGASHGWGVESRLHLLSAWVREDGISMGQLATDEKSNEITAIPTLLESLDINGSTVTIDAMGCQREIAQCIRDGDANYILAVKQNQPTLYEEIREYFEWAKTNPIEMKCLDVNEKQAKEHGRETIRRTTVANDVRWFESREKWAGLHCFIMSETTTITNEKTTYETRFYISSLEASAKNHAHFIRGHWSIENQLHWQLDVTFGEDKAKIKKDNSPLNWNVMRKTALPLIRNTDFGKKKSVKQLLSS